MNLSLVVSIRMPACCSWVCNCSTASSCFQSVLFKILRNCWRVSSVKSSVIPINKLLNSLVDVLPSSRATCFKCVANSNLTSLVNWPKVSRNPKFLNISVALVCCSWAASLAFLIISTNAPSLSLYKSFKAVGKFASISFSRLGISSSWSDVNPLPDNIFFNQSSDKIWSLVFKEFAKSFNLAIASLLAFSKSFPLSW